MPIFTDSDLDDFSDLATDLALKDSCNILRAVKTDDGQRGSTSEWIIVATVACLVVDSHPTRDVVEAGQLAGKVYKKVLLPRGTDVLSDDRLSIGNYTYDVIECDDPTSYEVLRRVSVIRQGQAS